MEKIRKIAIWLWDNKERAVLGVMVIFLGYRVFVMINPPEPAPVAQPARPQPSGEVQVPEPELTPPQPDRPSYDPDALVSRNPFWTRGGGAAQPGARDRRQEREDEIDISLDRINRMADGGYRARLSRGRSRSTVQEGDTFQGYLVLSIDGEDGPVELFNEETGDIVQLQLGN